MSKATERPLLPESFVLDVMTERQRQDAKWGTQRHDHAVWMTVLTEEVGEVAQALLAFRAHPADDEYDRMRAELVQVAAVCAAWIDHLDDEEWL